jgi:hypothetical protein
LFQRSDSAPRGGADPSLGIVSAGNLQFFWEYCEARVFWSWCVAFARERRSGSDPRTSAPAVAEL